MRPLLIVDCYLDPEGGAGNYRRLLPGPIEVVRPPLGEPIPCELTQYRAVCISGSAANISQPPGWLGPVEQLVCQSAQSHTPLLGICFGHQVIASAFCGRASVGPNQVGHAEVGFRPVELLRPFPLFTGLPAGFLGFMSHQEEVRPALPGLIVHARSADCPVQALSVPARPIWGIQFHPEMDRPEIDDLLHRRAERHPELGLDHAAELALWPGPETGRRVFENFLQLID